MSALQKVDGETLISIKVGGHSGWWDRFIDGNEVTGRCPGFHGEVRLFPTRSDAEAAYNDIGIVTYPTSSLFKKGKLVRQWTH